MNERNRKPPQDRVQANIIDQDSAKNKEDVDVEEFLKVLEARQATLMSRMEQTQDLISSIRYTRDYKDRANQTTIPEGNNCIPEKTGARIMSSKPRSVSSTPRRSGIGGQGDDDSRTADAERGITSMPSVDTPGLESCPSDNRSHRSTLKQAATSKGSANMELRIQ
mmetsp:Transcript_26961/g.39854  ORF Transcript_26961/g.39854 Transcript_26961/m.39854 type:complete len:166 (-) Transcript_26961:330-827(-)